LTRCMQLFDSAMDWSTKSSEFAPDERSLVHLRDEHRGEQRCAQKEKH
jgi:hypothetical protein